MAEQELLLLQILKIPVIVIKYLAKVLSIATYLPNYLILLIVDHFLFSDAYTASLLIYSLMWLPKLALLLLSLLLFCLQFWTIFHFLQLENHGLLIQVAGVVLTLAGLLILMRKGYLSLIEKYNLSKLKSVKEHIQLGFVYAVDVVGVVLAIINIGMVVNCSKTLAYNYHPFDYQYRYLKHISRTVRESFIIYLQFFYVKVFFRVFTWRFRQEQQTYLSEKKDNNVLNCLVLLTLVYLSTCLDLCFFLLFGLPNVLHFKRKLYYKSLGETHKKWRATLSHFWFISAHTFQLCVEALAFPICWKESRQCIQMMLPFEDFSKLFGDEFKTLLIKCMIRLPYFFCNICIYPLRYKSFRRDLLVRRYYQTLKQSANKNELIVQQMTFRCFGEQFVDAFFFPLTGVAVLLQPWKAGWIKHLMKHQYELDRQYIVAYLSRCLKEYSAFPFAILFNLPLLCYHSKQILVNFRDSRDKINREYKQLLNSAPSNGEDVSQGWEYTKRGSLLIEFTFCSLKSIKGDFLHLPAFFLTKMTFLSVYDSSLEPTTAINLLLKLNRQYYRLYVTNTPQSEFYLEMFRRMKASGNLHGDEQQGLFWRVAYKCERLITLQRVVKLLLKRRWIEGIEQKVKAGRNLTEISNHYWHQHQLFKAFLLKLVAKVIELIVSVIGVVFMLPLTLWRLPTFIKLYAFHNKKYLFFKILFSVYEQMLRDVLMVPVQVVSLLTAPKMFFCFVRNTAFQYGPDGINTFKLYQQKKRRYLLQVIFIWTFVTIILHCEIIFIYATWIRIRYLKNYLRHERLTVLKFYQEYILTSPTIPNMEAILAQQVEGQFRNKLKNHLQHIHQEVFLEALRDLPYLILIAFLLVTMPWRVNYILQAVRDARDDKDERKSFIRLLRNIFKDYACIILNILLLLSGFKSRKALLLIRRNYRLNFFIGFLEYSYFNELVKEIYSLGLIYVDVVYFAVACLFGWPRAHLLVRQLLALSRRIKEEEESADLNKKIYENTVRSGKELQLLNKMGFYNYVNVCSFLTIPEIISMRRVDKLNYQVSRREEIWFTKWETLFSKQYNFVDEEFENRCRKAFLIQQQGNNREVVSHHSIILAHFNRNVHEEGVDVAVAARDFLPEKVYEYIFKDYNYNLNEGYGPENELPQTENQDEQFLRLTNQVRRPKLFQTENATYRNWLVYKPVEKIIQILHRQFRVDRSRRKKQALFILIAVGSVSVILMLALRLVVGVLWLEDSFAGIRILLIIELLALLYSFNARFFRLFPQWISLIPFDLYFDLIRGLTYLRDDIWKKRVVNPVTSLIQKLFRLLSRIYRSIADKLTWLWEKITEKVTWLWEKITEKATWVWRKIKIAGEKTVAFTAKYSKIAYERIFLPLYLRVANVLRKIKDFVVLLFQKVFSVLKTIVNGIVNFFIALFKSIYNSVYAIFSNANRFYYFVLKTSMKFLLGFGLLGNLAFTVVGLTIMTLPTLIWWFLYSERWYLVVSSIHTMVLIVVGYKHLNNIKKEK